eukprot:scaffold1637_cov195-Alexandrium_tamarense.AAC.21
MSPRHMEECTSSDQIDLQMPTQTRQRRLDHRASHYRPGNTKASSKRRPRYHILFIGALAIGSLPSFASAQSASPISTIDVTSPSPVDTLTEASFPPNLKPTSEPTTIAPTISHIPSAFPSYPPTFYPTISHRPSASPTVSAAPSFPPSTSKPSYAPLPLPTPSPVIPPSAAPSLNTTTIIKRECSQILEISQNTEFNEVEIGIYQLQMQSYTANFGWLVSSPGIVTTCAVSGQDLAGGRRRGLLRLLDPLKRAWGRRTQTVVTPKILLVIQFTIMYESRYGYAIEDYPSLFQGYINGNLDTVTVDMQNRFLPVVSAGEVIVYNTKVPTISPTVGDGPPVIGGSPSPTIINGTDPSEPMYPSSAPSLRNSSSPGPSILLAPFMASTPKPTKEEIVEDRQSFVVGIAAGLTGAALVVLMIVIYKRRKNKQRKDAMAMVNADEAQRKNEMAATGTYYDLDTGVEVKADNDGMDRDYDEEGNIGNGDYLRDPPHNPAADSIMSNPSMVSGAGSFSSHGDGQEGVPLDPLQDEFDNYKNQSLEKIRNGVEESVYGAEGMMSLAMTRALMEEEGDVDVSWGGAVDSESLEANMLCETNDWLRKNENSSLDRRNQFFQEILNKMVITVRRDLIRPNYGTQAMHCCAAMLGLQLEKDIPNNVLLVYGMRKTNDLSQAKFYLMEAFKPFGDIENAAIAPSNKGFGELKYFIACKLSSSRV